MPPYLDPSVPTRIPQQSEEVTRVPGGVYSYSEQICRNEATIEVKVLEYPTSSLDERLLTAFKHAAGTVTTPNWSDWYHTCQITALLHPIDFTTALVKGFVTYIWKEFVDILSFFADILIWLAKTNLCINAYQVLIFSVEDIAKSSVCEPIRQIVQIIKSIEIRVRAFFTLGVEAALNPEVLKVVFELKNLGWVVLADILELIGDSEQDLQNGCAAFQAIHPD